MQAFETTTSATVDDGAAAPPYPGIPAIVDGSEAVAHVEIARSPRSPASTRSRPSTTMAAIYQAAVADGRTNLWGTPLAFIEPESEHSSASAAEGVALAGGAGHELHRRPGPRPDEGGPVRHRRQAPAGRLPRRRAGADEPGPEHPRRPRRRDGRGRHAAGGSCSPATPRRPPTWRRSRAGSPRRRETPFIVAQDGFLTTHTLENVRLPEDDAAARLRRRPARARPRPVRSRRGADDRRRPEPGQLHEGPDRPARVHRPDPGGARRRDGRVARAAPAARYAPIDGVPDATTRPRSSSRWARSPTRRSPSSTTSGSRAGRSAASPSPRSGRSRPTAPASPSSSDARAVAVVERTDEPLAAANPLTREIKAALYEAAAEGELGPARPLVRRPGLGSRDVAAGDLVAVFDWLAEHRRDGARGTPSSASATRWRCRAPTSTSGPPGAWSHARPLDRRVRQRDDEQARRDAGRRAVRQAASRPIRATARRRRACRRPTT